MNRFDKSCLDRNLDNVGREAGVPQVDLALQFDLVLCLKVSPGAFLQALIDKSMYFSVKSIDYSKIFGRTRGSPGRSLVNHKKT